MAVELQSDTGLHEAHRAGEMVAIPKTQGAPIHLEKSPLGKGARRQPRDWKDIVGPAIFIRARIKIVGRPFHRGAMKRGGAGL